MSNDALTNRGKALEEIFFAGREQQLLAELRQQAQQERSIEELEVHTGIHDHDLLQKVVEMGVSHDTLAAFSVVPLLAVAWGDSVLDAAERDAILLEASASGLSRSGGAYKLLESWLTASPNRELVDAWKAFHTALGPLLDEADREALKAGLTAKAKRVARCSGGVFGFGAISEGEQAALAELEVILG